MRVSFSRRFLKDFEKCPTKIQRAFRQRLELFTRDQFAPLLNNHNLSGRLAKFRSINITGDWRVIFEVGNKFVGFIAIGTHSQLYKK